MKYLKYIVLTLLSFVMPVSAMAAEDEYDIELDAYYSGRYVLLKWYPQSYEIYRKCSEKGFTVERRVLGEQWQTMGTIIPGSYADFTELERKEKKALMVKYLLFPEQTEQNLTLEDATDTEEETNKDNVDVNDNSTDVNDPDNANYLYQMCLMASEFSIDMARVMALNFSDEFVNTQQTYEYRVRPADDHLKMKCKVVRVQTNRKQALAPMAKIKAENKDHRVQLSWDMASLMRDYSGFQLERSSDGINYKVVNEEPIVYMYNPDYKTDYLVCADSLPDCGKKYYYRVRGLNRFGFKSEYSNVVTASYDCPFNVNVKLNSVKLNKQNVATLIWEVTNPDNQEIAGFDIQRTSEINVEGGNYVSVLKGKLLPANTRTYKDKNTDRDNYYRVIAYSKGKKDMSVSNLYYIHSIDSVPPSAPTGLKAVIDSAGVVELTWKPNPEPDVMAYRVFFSNDSTLEFLGASDTFLTKPYYTDTLNLGSLTNEIYYKVLAIDSNYNQGPLSKAIRLVKPDTIPPAPARFLDLEQDSAGYVHVTWQKSVSTDVVKQVLLRRLNETGEFEVAETWTGKENIPDTYTDTIIANGERFYYKLVVYDESNNKTERESFPLKSKYKKRDCVKNATATVNYKKGCIEVRWEKCGCKIKKVNIFRKGSDAPSKLVGSTYGVEMVFYDTTVKKGEQYQYIIQPVTEKMSKVAKTEEVTF